MIPSRCPPKYSDQRIGGPEVSTMWRVIPGTTSIAGRMSTSTGSALVSRSNAAWLAWAVVIGTSEEPDPALPLGVGNLVVELCPLHRLFLQVRLLELRAQDLLRQWVALEVVQRFEQSSRYDVDLALGQQLVAGEVEIVVGGCPRIE